MVLTTYAEKGEEPPLHARAHTHTKYMFKEGKTEVTNICVISIFFKSDMIQLIRHYSRTVKIRDHYIPGLWLIYNCKST